MQSMQATLGTPTSSALSRFSTSTQDKSSTTGQTSSTGPQPSRPSIIPPPSKSKGWSTGASGGRMRRIIAEDPEWSLAIVPLLTELCIQHIVENFQSESVPAVGRGGKGSERGGVGGDLLEARPERLGPGAAPALPHHVLIPHSTLPSLPRARATRFPPALCPLCLCRPLTFPTLSSKTQPKPYLLNSSSRKPSLVDYPPHSPSTACIGS